MLNQVVHTVTTGHKHQTSPNTAFRTEKKNINPIKALFVATCFPSFSALFRTLCPQLVFVSKTACHLSVSEILYKHWR